jgi:predicted DNA-binding transcriptional regulator YafY
MRADRLVATLLVLQARGRVTAAELAAELEVSVATARRDLEALSTAGVPVYPQAGRGGGWSLVGGARTDLSGLTADETRTLFLLLGPATAGRPEARSALRKLLGAVPRTFREDALAAGAAVVVDPAGWGEASRTPRPEHAAALEAAVVAGHQVRLRYAGRDGAREWTLDPWGVVDKDGRWYLLAGTAAGQRTFRVDRVLDVQATAEPARRPPGFDLAAAWQEVVAAMEARRGEVSATVELPAGLAPVLLDRFGRQARLLGERDGTASVEVRAHTVGALAEQLAGWGLMVVVVGPEAVRAELARIGAALVAAYGGPAPAAGEPGRA